MPWTNHFWEFLGRNVESAGIEEGLVMWYITGKQDSV
jgi:hypothetical protein